jgi:hypothetical protein
MLHQDHSHQVVTASNQQQGLPSEYGEQLESIYPRQQSTITEGPMVVILWTSSTAPHANFAYKKHFVSSVLNLNHE